jgi:hypothetical protein
MEDRCLRTAHAKPGRGFGSNVALQSSFFKENQTHKKRVNYYLKTSVAFFLFIIIGTSRDCIAGLPEECHARRRRVVGG